MQRHGKRQHDHVVDHQVDVQHIPAGEEEEEQEENLSDLTTLVCSSFPRLKPRRPAVSPGLLLELLVLKEGVDEGSVDAVDDEAEGEGDDVFHQGVAPAVHMSGGVHGVQSGSTDRVMKEKGEKKT